MESDGSNLTQVTPTPGNTVFTASVVAWSPQNDLIVYDNSQTLIIAGNPNGPLNNGYQLYVFGAEGYKHPSWQPVVSSYVRPVGAGPIRDALVPAQRACLASAANATHEAPFANASCSPPPGQASTYLTVGTPDVNSQPPKMSGYHRMSVDPGIPTTPADEADISLEVSVSDVRNKSNLTDYGGQLEVVTNLRITDRRNGGFGPGTVTDFPMRYAVDCVTTSDTTVGSDCDINTTADALFPNAVKEGKRSIWEVHGSRSSTAALTGSRRRRTTRCSQWKEVFVP